MKKIDGWLDGQKKMKKRWMVGWIEKKWKKKRWMDGLDGWLDKNMKKIDGWLDG